VDIASIQPILLLALFVAIVLTAYEMRVSLRPTSCPECPHCQATARERAQRERELETWYARRNGLDGDEDDDRRIG
jgi:hypothetical protein